MKRILATGGIVTLGILTAVVSIRLSTDALSILVGAFLGMTAILPTIVLVAYLLKKNQDAMAEATQTRQMQPPVVVVSGGMMPPQYFSAQPPAPPQNNPAMLPPPSPSAPRKFHLLGYEEVDEVELSDETWMKSG